ncbi:hypothetical protein KBD45_03495 [Candidatus Dojkabacteria bacterium]|nr:hypothetical protein [Candidatus Dojkabacteria bacterium]
MQYKIKSVTRNEETVTTTVEYDFNGKIVTVDVAHFAPSNVAEVKRGIKNRGASEKAKLNAIDVCVALQANIEATLIDVTDSFV